MKKISKSVIAIALSLSTAFGLAACGGQQTPGASTDPKTLNVRVRKGGYGEEWVRDLAANFERVYKAEGYKVNLVNPSTDMKGNVALLEMAQGTNETNMDLYITADITPEQLGVNGDYGIIAEDVSEMVFNQKPIKYDGTEEDTLVRDKLEDALLPYTASSKY